MVQCFKSGHYFLDIQYIVVETTKIVAAYRGKNYARAGLHASIAGRESPAHVRDLWINYGVSSYGCNLARRRSMLANINNERVAGSHQTV